MEKQTLNYTYEVGGGTYTISDRVTLAKKDKNVEFLDVRIKDWSNRRYLIIDRKNSISYFQASSEGNECYRCGICQKRMKAIGWRTNHDFVRIEGYTSLYQKMNGVPKDLTIEGLGSFLGLPVTE